MRRDDFHRVDRRIRQEFVVVGERMRSAPLGRATVGNILIDVAHCVDLSAGKVAVGQPM